MGVSTDFKSSNRIEISWLVQVLLNFYWFWGSPWGSGWAWGWVWVCGGCPMHTCSHMHIKHDKHGCLHVGGHLQFLYMYTCVCVCVCAHIWEHPHVSRHPPPICPLPRVTGIPNTPHPHAPPPELRKPKSEKSLERIEIIQFCLKIWDPWTLLHTYRLGLMSRWGEVSYPEWHFYVLDPKKCSCDLPIKNFPVFALDPIRPYLDWALTGFLTS